MINHYTVALFPYNHHQIFPDFWVKIRSSSDDLDEVLALVGYETVRDERASPWPVRPLRQVGVTSTV